MALTDENNGGGIPATMLVGPASVGNGGYPYPVPMYGQGGGNGMFGDGNGWWVILLILVLFAGNWNNNGNNGGFGGQPIIVNDGGFNGVQRGFDQAAIMSGINGINAGISGLSTQLCGCCGDISTQLCNGFNGVTASVTNGVNTLAQQMYTNQLAELERSFAAQTASTQGMTALQAQLAQYSGDNRLATEGLKYTIATENCADRYEASQNTQAIIANDNRNNQLILDKLCQLELDGYKRENESLRSQLTDARFAASQAAQTATFQQGLNDEVDQLYNRLSSCPIPSTPVFGRTPIFQCNNNGCGCGNM